jgi:bifunctional DNase/RNase
MTVKVVALDPRSQQPLVLLVESEGTRLLPIVVGVAEAMAINAELEGEHFPRPLTHDLIKRLLEVTGAQVEKAVVSDLRESVFYATLFLDQGGTKLEVDARPSDAIAIALRVKCPIFAEERVLDEAAIPMGRVKFEGEEDELDAQFRAIIESLEEPPGE